MSQDMAVLKANLNQAAIGHGVTAVGAVMVNKYGIEWRVDGGRRIHNQKSNRIPLDLE